MLSQQRGKDVSVLTMCRACQHLDLRRKRKSYYAAKPQRDEVKKRQDSLDTVEEFPAQALIFIDETGAKLDLCSDYGRTEGGQRVHAAKFYDRGKNISIIGAIGLVDVIGAMYGEWAIDSSAFLSLVQTRLVPYLRPGAYRHHGQCQFPHESTNQRRPLSVLAHVYCFYHLTRLTSHPSS